MTNAERRKHMTTEHGYSAKTVILTTNARLKADHIALHQDSGHEHDFPLKRS